MLQAQPGSGYAPILRARTLTRRSWLRIDGRAGPVAVMPVPQTHGEIGSLGYRFGGLAYSPDVSDVPDGTAAAVAGSRRLDRRLPAASRRIRATSSVKRALEWIERLKPKRAILTHMTADIDYETLRRELPEGVEPAYDGMVVEFD